KAGKVADDAAAKRDEDGRTIGACGCQFRSKALDFTDALKAFARRKEEDSGLFLRECCEEVFSPEGPDLRRRDDKSTACGPEELRACDCGKEIASDDDRVIRRSGFDVERGHDGIQFSAFSVQEKPAYRSARNPSQGGRESGT